MKGSLKITFISALSALVGISAMIASAEETFHLGDVNGDNLVDAVDATLILSNYAAVSTGQEFTLDEEQLKRADTNGDGLVDASDSTMVLGYYASVATGSTMTSEEYYTNALAGSVPDNDVPIQTSPTTETPAPVVSTSVKPNGMGVHCNEAVVSVPDIVIPAYTEPVTEQQTEPITEPVTEPITEPEVVHGEGCQYFHNGCEADLHCNEGNDGYPAGYDDEDKENFKYAYNEALKYGDEYMAVSWGTGYVAALVGRDKSEVFLGDPSDGEADRIIYTVWVLAGYTEDGDEIWHYGR